MAAPTGRGRALPDLLLGLVGGAMVVFALVAVVMGRGASEVPAVSPPAVTVLSPAPGGVAPSRLEIVFETDEEILPSPSGWGTGELHLHLALDGQEIMASPDAIEILGAGRYRWVVPGVVPGEHEMRFFWADGAHRVVEGGGSAAVRVRVR